MAYVLGQLAEMLLLRDHLLLLHMLVVLFSLVDDGGLRESREKVGAPDV